MEVGVVESRYQPQAEVSTKGRAAGHSQALGPLLYRKSLLIIRNWVKGRKGFEG